MNGIYQHYIIDMSSNNNFVQVPTVQGDGNGVRGFEVELIENGVPYQIDAKDVVISIMGTKPDTTGIFNECSLTEEGYVLVDITSQMSAVKGRGDYEIVLMSRSKNSQLKSFPFFIITTPSALDIDYLISSDEFQTLTKRILECDQSLEDMQELEEIVTANENERIENENTRKENEQTRQDNEATRQSNESQRQENEQERQDNEDKRKSNEDQRIANENLRSDAEETRKVNESIRQNNESVREQNEYDRKDNDTIREANEDKRIANESDRINAEDVRESNENIRQENERTRKQFEEIRQKNEQNRNNAELERVRNEEQRESNEIIRENYENERVTSEEIRVSAENVRRDNEAVRQSNESLREDTETERKTNESERQSAEENRIDAENERQTNETDRQNAENERQETFESLEQSMNEGLKKLDVTNETAKNYADLSQSYAVGGTGTRENENIDNAKYYYEQSRAISEGFTGALKPMGTTEFENLPSLSVAVTGDMYNISNEFTTTTEFKEGAGYIQPPGTNIYKTADGFWDCLAGTLVVGIKGSAETSYRNGYINITPENLGITIVNNTKDSEKRVSYSESSGKSKTSEIAESSNNSMKFNGFSIWHGTEADYQALATKDSKTIYYRY